jgi:hypothetical protein
MKRNVIYQTLTDQQFSDLLFAALLRKFGGSAVFTTDMVRDQVGNTLELIQEQDEDTRFKQLIVRVIERDVTDGG